MRMIGVIGPNKENCTSAIYSFGFELGQRLIDLGFSIVCGGKQGIMEAVCKGARFSEKYVKGKVIGIIPEATKESANPYCDIIIPTGIGYARNQIIVNTADILIAVAGGAGTLSEIAFAWQMNKRVICFTGFDGWSKTLAGKDLDARSEGLLFEAKTLLEIEMKLQSLFS